MNADDNVDTFDETMEKLTKSAMDDIHLINELRVKQRQQYLNLQKILEDMNREQCQINKLF
jgi:hypothetical protein